MCGPQWGRAQRAPEVDARVLAHVDLAGAAAGVAVGAAGRQLDVLARALGQLRVAHAAVAGHACHAAAHATSATGLQVQLYLGQLPIHLACTEPARPRWGRRQPCYAMVKS